MGSEGHERGRMKTQRPTKDSPGGPRVRKICTQCKWEFWPRIVDVKAGGGRHCSSNCSSAALRTRNTNPCQRCGKPLNTFVKRTKQHPQCSVEASKEAICACGAKYQKGKGARKMRPRCTKERPLAKATIGGMVIPVRDIAKAAGLSPSAAKSRLRNNGGRVEVLFEKRVKGGSDRSYRWANSARRFVFEGKELTVKEIATELGISSAALRMRLLRQRPERAFARRSGESAPSL
jgi:hypothetical protein